MKSILSSFLLLFLCTTIHATDFTVTNNNDAGVGSFRQALTDANGDATATALAPHTITFNGAYTISLASALPSLNNHVIVNATGNNIITINAFSGSSVLVVATGRTVVLNYLTLQGATGVTNGGGITNNGTATLNNCMIQNNAATNGGGIRTYGNLTCNNCTFSNNTGLGSAIYSASLGTITLDRCLVQNNSGAGAALHVVLSGTATTIAGMATLNISNSIIKNNTNSSSSTTGGGVFAAAIASITNSELSGNTAGRGGGITLGLGLTNTSTSTTYKTQLTIDKSTISGNSTNGLNASALGGGIYIQGGSADLTSNCSIINSTISGNNTSAIGGVVTTTAGGGINFGGGGTSAWVTTLTVSNCTIISNTVDGNSSNARGGALERVQGSVILNYSIAAGNNSNSSANNKDIHTNTTTIFGSTTGRNLLGAVGNGTTATGNSLFALSGSAVTTGNVLLTNAISTVLNTTLADNGGTTALPDGSYVKTHALVTGGSQTAINPTVAASGLQTVDQRGATRDATPDIGAFEYFAPTTWSGATNNSWSTSSNWSNGVPTAFMDAVVNSGTPSITDARTVANLTLGNTTTITNTGTLNVTNNLTNNGSISGAGTTVLNGTIAQSISGTGTISNLTINNASGVTVTSGSNLVNITGVLTPAAGTLTTNGNLTLISTATTTASIGTVSGSISGSVNIQRFIPSGRRTTRFLGHPFSNTLTMGSLIDNIYITGDGSTAGTGSATTGTGFDGTTTNAASSFWFDNTSQTWKAFTSTSDASWTLYRGIRVLVRGDRTQPTALTGGSPTPNSVVLDITGTVNTGNQNISVPTGYSVVSNPYPSPVNIGTRLNATANIGTQYWVWDANAGLTAGAYVTKVVNGTTYNLAMNGAFVVQPTATTSIAFVEGDKQVTPTDGLFSTNTLLSSLLELQVLYNNYPTDNMFVRFKTNSSDNKDGLDGEKLSNPEVNLYALSSDGKKLSLDTRPFANNKIIPLGFTATAANNFVIKVADYGISESVYLKDKYLNTLTKLTATTEYSFSVDPSNTATMGENRFELVLTANSITLPTTILNLTAAQKNAGIEVTWTTANEVSLNSYEVEESVDGINFTKASTVAAKSAASNTYSWLDASILNGDNYYRIKIVEKNGESKYSDLVKVKIGGKASEFMVYPNPVKGGVISLQMSNVEKGIYTVRIYNNIGQEVATKTINYAGGSATQTIDLDKGFATGKYNLQITNGTTVITKTVIVE